MNDNKLYTGDSDFRTVSCLLKNEWYIKFRRKLDRIYDERADITQLDFSKEFVNIANLVLIPYHAKFVSGVEADPEHICFASAEDMFEFLMEWS